MSFKKSRGPLVPANNLSRSTQKLPLQNTSNGKISAKPNLKAPKLKETVNNIDPFTVNSSSKQIGTRTNLSHTTARIPNKHVTNSLQSIQSQKKKPITIESEESENDVKLVKEIVNTNSDDFEGSNAKSKKSLFHDDFQDAPVFMETSKSKIKKIGSFSKVDPAENLAKQVLKGKANMELNNASYGFSLLHRKNSVDYLEKTSYELPRTQLIGNDAKIKKIESLFEADDSDKTLNGNFNFELEKSNTENFDFESNAEKKHKFVHLLENGLDSPDSKKGVTGSLKRMRKNCNLLNSVDGHDRNLRSKNVLVNTIPDEPINLVDDEDDLVTDEIPAPVIILGLKVDKEILSGEYSLCVSKNSINSNFQLIISCNSDAQFMKNYAKPEGYLQTFCSYLKKFFFSFYSSNEEDSDKRVIVIDFDEIEHVYRNESFYPFVNVFHTKKKINDSHLFCVTFRPNLAQDSVSQDSARMLRFLCSKINNSTMNRDLFIKVSNENSTSRSIRLRKNNYYQDESVVILKYPSALDSDMIAITQGDFNRLLPGEFLNDNIIDFYLKYLKNPNNSISRTSGNIVNTSFFYSTFFFKLWHDVKGGIEVKYKSVKKWSRGEDLFSKDAIFIPINMHLHWTLIIVFKANLIELDEDSYAENENYPCIMYFDSLKHATNDNVNYIQSVRSYLAAEYLDKKVKPLGDKIKAFDADKDSTEYKSLLDEFNRVSHVHKTKFSVKKLPGLDIQAPKQVNSVDCGVYLIQYAENFCLKPFISRDKEKIRKYYLKWTNLKPESIEDKRRKLATIISTLSDESVKDNSLIAADVKSSLQSSPVENDDSSNRELPNSLTLDDEVVLNSLHQESSLETELVLSESHINPSSLECETSYDEQLLNTMNSDDELVLNSLHQSNSVINDLVLSNKNSCEFIAPDLICAVKSKEQRADTFIIGNLKSTSIKVGMEIDSENGVNKDPTMDYGFFGEYGETNSLMNLEVQMELEDPPAQALPTHEKRLKKEE